MKKKRAMRFGPSCGRWAAAERNSKLSWCADLGLAGLNGSLLAWPLACILGSNLGCKLAVLWALTWAELGLDLSPQKNVGLEPIKANKTKQE